MRRIELLYHVSVVSAATALFVVRGYQYSRQFDAGAKWDGYAPGLRPGWFGFRVDLSDVQWREFRRSLPHLITSMVGFAGWNSVAARPGTGLTRRLSSSLVFSLAFVGYLHGMCLVYVLGLLVSFHTVAWSVAGRRAGALIIWTGALGALLVVRLTNGLHPSKLGLSNHVLFARGPLRWDICFNLCTLRMLSYGMDLHWARCAARTAASGVRGKPSFPPANAALPATLPGSHAALLSFLAYALYPPLYIAGPIMRYSDFLAQQRALSEHGRRRGLWWETVRYTLRALCDWVCVELLTHTLYFNSLAAHRIGPLYQPYGLRWGAQQAALTGFWVLAFMWAKFATIWRVMRAAALLDGVSAPENMRRCFANNYDMEGFWRGWHSSFNRWLIRYMYVPLGGARTRLASIWLIFLFVALWHDLEWRLLGWAWLVCLAFLPELLIKQLARSDAAAGARAHRGWRHACAAGGALNISALMIANLAGFVVGVDGVRQLLRELLHAPAFVAAAITVFFSATHLMFEIREWESRQAKHGRNAAET